MMIPKQKLPSVSSAQSGFTIIECLLAIIIVAILMVAVSPAIVLSVATRVQARRVELATQAAQTYIDGLRAGKIPPPPYGVVMKPDLTQNPSNANLLNTFAAPQGGALTCPPPLAAGDQPTVTNVYCKDNSGYQFGTLYCVDLDREAGCTKGDFVVQGFRSFTADPTNPAQPNLSDDGSQGYLLGIRVYRADAIMSLNGPFKTSGNSQTVPGKARKAATFTGGVGDRAAPLVETTTTIRTGQTTYETLRERLGVESDRPNLNGGGNTTP
ncbi:MAG: hormogonium polysaccharide secretion pseudopilin HpsB [Cyanobacteriota bacterium]